MYTHSVTLEANKCIGCTDCIKRCPTEAIRVRNSKAQIIEERCIDCGNCIRICRNGAKKAVTDGLDLMQNYRYRIALPAPSFYAQFPKAPGIEWILEALLQIGFTDYFEVAITAEVVAEATYTYLKQAPLFPVISSACPAIVRLIQRRFPALLPQVLPIVSPMELAARYVKQVYVQKGIDLNDVGVFFISPCPAKATEIRRPKGIKQSMVDGVLSMQDLYKKMQGLVGKIEPKQLKQSTHKGLVWATRNGGIDENKVKGYMAVDGMENIIDILEKVEDGTLNHINYIEAMACTGGCLGGALTIENPYVSRSNLKKWITLDRSEMKQGEKRGNYRLFQEIQALSTTYECPIKPRPVFSLNENRSKALEMIEGIEKLYERLPQIDCGSCGAPTCRCFAEDVMRQEVNIEACIFMLRRKIKELSDEMHQLAYTVIPTESENAPKDLNDKV
ncbi:MAG: 4Fe-4S binding protein [Cellulosilyticum sp.]|nr:4Fe-4S binding protein [Cellulosilyticum sp.]